MIENTTLSLLYDRCKQHLLLIVLFIYLLVVALVTAAQYYCSPVPPIVGNLCREDRVGGEIETLIFYNTTKN